MKDATHAKLLDALRGRVWHATSVECYKSIKADGFIRVRPPRHQYQKSFCQHSGRVSLFDFRDAPGLADAIDRGDWLGFLGGVPGGLVVFLGLDPSLPVIPAATLVAESNDARISGRLTGPQGSRLIADLETGHLGDIPAHRIVEVFQWEPQTSILSHVPL